MRRVLEQIVLLVRLALLDLADLLANREHGVAETIELGFGSLSVGSTIRVPATGKETVGGWKP